LRLPIPPVGLAPWFPATGTPIPVHGQVRMLCSHRAKNCMCQARRPRPSPAHAAWQGCPADPVAIVVLVVVPSRGPCLGQSTRGHRCSLALSPSLTPGARPVWGGLGCRRARRHQAQRPSFTVFESPVQHLPPWLPTIAPSFGLSSPRVLATTPSSKWVVSSP
jgi:hypothetical protein